MATKTPQLNALAADNTFCVLGVVVRIEAFEPDSSQPLPPGFFDLIQSQRMGSRAEDTVTADSDTTKMT